MPFLLPRVPSQNPFAMVANVRRQQSKLDGLLANICKRSRSLAFIERRAWCHWFDPWHDNCSFLGLMIIIATGLFLSYCCRFFWLLWLCGKAVRGMERILCGVVVKRTSGKHGYDLTLSQTAKFRLFQTEGVCRRQFQILWKWKKILRTGRKQCVKRRNCLLWAISPFPTVFSKALYFRHVKTRACLGKG